MPRKKKAPAVPSDPPGIQPLGPLDPSYGAFQPRPVPPTDPQNVSRDTKSKETKKTDSKPGTSNATTEATETAAQDTQNDQGDKAAVSIAPDVDGDTLTREGRPNYAVIGRFTSEGRWRDISPIRDQMMIEARAKGLTKLEAQHWTYRELDRLYPPLPPKEKPEPVAVQEVTPTDDKIGGLYLVPEAWPPMADNASLQAELGWVQSQRLTVIEERGNSVVVHLERASCPAPSKAALGWLETSIRSYSKYVDVVAKVLAGQADEAEATRRERMRLDDIRSLLDEMHRAG